MAIGLSDIQKNRNTKTAVVNSMVLEKLSDANEAKDRGVGATNSWQDRSVRPWEDSLSPETFGIRTYAAREAVKKAQKIVARNERASQFFQQSSPNYNVSVVGDSMRLIDDKKEYGVFSKIKDLINFYF